MAANPVPAAAAAVAPSPAAPSPAAATAPKHSSKCEVEFDGSVKYPKPLPANQRFWIYVAQGDCLAKDARIIGRNTTTPEGLFSLEVFSDWGSDLSFCAAAVAGLDKPSTLYGKAVGKFHAEAEGEIVFKGITIVPKPGPAHTFPPFNGNAAVPGAPK